MRRFTHRNFGSQKCSTCDRLLVDHVILTHAELEWAWEGGCVLTVCDQLNDKEVSTFMEDDVDEPCDEEFMKEISS